MALEPLTGEDPAEFAGYRLRARLGTGAVAQAYLGYTASGRPVVLKVARPEAGLGPGFRVRFRREMDAARRVRGRHTARVLAADPDTTRPWLATAYVAGPSLRQVVAGHGPLPDAAVLRLVAGVAAALRAMHR
ncbi:MAG TPA: phosphotransferase, partial [Streptosporangiaceae bacterium]